MRRNQDDLNDANGEGGFLVPPDATSKVRLETIFDNNTGNHFDYNIIPDECPICHHGIDARIKLAFIENYAAEDAQVVFQCPRKNCLSFFIGYYKGAPRSGRSFVFVGVKPRKPVERDFSEIITSISQQFVVIYRESHIAEQLNLSQICGVGYRKALEYLIKDYAINKANDNVQVKEIKTKFLGDVIKNYIDENNIQASAERATWLGNDETHYVRKWIDKDINDLKNLIELTIRWIELVEMSKEYKDQMP